MGGFGNFHIIMIDTGTNEKRIDASRQISSFFDILGLFLYLCFRQDSIQQRGAIHAGKDFEMCYFPLIMVLSDDVRIFACMDDSLPLDVVLIEM